MTIIRISFSILGLVWLSACSQQVWTQCLIGPTFKVRLTGNVPSGLDGYDYTICPLKDGKSCDDYNQVKSLRPSQLMISIIGDDVVVRQAGGSIGIYKTDPIGMSDPNYLLAHHIYLTLNKAEKGESWVKGFVGSREVRLANCD